jgi:hypothetical protein
MKDATISNDVVVRDEAALAELGLTEFSPETQVDDYPILALGGDVPATGREENTAYAGDTIVGFLVGTVPMWSLEPKENWKEEKAEGRTYWTSVHYKFIGKDGKTFGLFSSSTLFNLQKIATSATDPVLTNPLIGVKYIGKIEGKEILKEQHGIEITKGNSAHVCKILTGKDVKIDPFMAGCVNYTRNPLPNFGSKEKLSKIEQAKANFAAIEARKAQRAEEASQKQLQ